MFFYGYEREGMRENIVENERVLCMLNRVVLEFMEFLS